MADLRLFVECTTKAVFDSHLANGDITANHIVFIQGTNQREFSTYFAIIQQTLLEEVIFIGF